MSEKKLPPELEKRMRNEAEKYENWGTFWQGGLFIYAALASAVEEAKAEARRELLNEQAIERHNKKLKRLEALLERAKNAGLVTPAAQPSAVEESK